MRVAMFALGVGLALLLGYCGYLVVATMVARRERRRLAATRWKVHHYSEQGTTVVAVQLALPNGSTVDEHTVDRFNDCSPDWNDRFTRAREQAEERVFHLNADRPTS